LKFHPCATLQTQKLTLNESTLFYQHHLDMNYSNYFIRQSALKKIMDPCKKLNILNFLMANSDFVASQGQISSKSCEKMLNPISLGLVKKRLNDCF